MPLECTVVCLDTSEWMRNGDHYPTRLAAQLDGVNLVCGAKLRANPESTVGVLTTGGDGVKVLSSPTDDIGKLLAALNGLTPGGGNHFVDGIKVAMLALRHRRNKHGGQRIVSFVGSPVNADDKVLKKLAVTLRKNNIRVDVVSVGENDANQDKLQTFVDTVNKEESDSHFVAVPAGVLPSDVLMSSPVILGEGGDGGGGAAGPAFVGGVDPSVDPELAEVLRLSAEEARANATATDDAGGAAAVAAATGDGGGGGGGGGDMDEEALLQQAIALSMMEAAGGGTGDGGDDTTADAPAAAPAAAPADGAAPPAASASTPPPAAPSTAATTDAPTDAAAAAAVAAAAAGDGQFLDPSFVQSLLSGLPVDVNDPSIQAAMAAATGGGATGGDGSGDAMEDEGDDKDKDKDKDGEGA